MKIDLFQITKAQFNHVRVAR